MTHMRLARAHARARRNRHYLNVLAYSARQSSHMITLSQLIVVEQPTARDLDRTVRRVTNQSNISRTFCY